MAQLQAILDAAGGTKLLLPLLVMLAAWLMACGVRMRWPERWERFANIPFGGGVTLNTELNRVGLVVRKVWQSLPTALFGAFVVWASGASDPMIVVGSLAPLWHELLKALPGPYGSKPK